MKGRAKPSIQNLPALPAVPGAERQAMLPVETLGGWAAVFTGETGARSGVPGNEWFERETLAAYAPVPLSVRAVRQTLGIYTDDLFGRTIATPTLFERAGVRSHVALGFVHRGADVFSTPDPSDIGDVLKAVFHLVADSKDAVYSTLDDGTVAGVRRAFRRHGVPDLQVAYLPGGDVLLMARDGTEAAPDGTVVDIPENRYSFGSPRRSGHGSATARDGLIPLVLAHPQRMGTTLRARMTGAVGPAPMQLDVTGLILALLAE